LVYSASAPLGAYGFISKFGFLHILGGSMSKVLIVFGTRPETIKVAPIIMELKKFSNKIICQTCVTGQHRQMVEPLLRFFNIEPDFDLDIMRENQTLEYITTSVINKVSEIIKTEHPDYLMVQGDTTTAMAAGLAAFYNRVKVAHVEAGLRTWNKYEPYPEEINRKIIDSLSDLCFAHTEQAKNNLLKEGIDEAKIEVTGNTVIDALLDVAGRSFPVEGTILEKLPDGNKKVILVTAHRRENFGEPIHNICRAIKMISQQRDDVLFIYPVHLNPNIQEPVYSHLGNMENIFLVNPLEYVEFVHLIKRAHFILSDSGGLQEESPSLGKPVLVLRDVTERPEALETGAIEVVGTDTDRIVSRFNLLMDDKEHYRRMSEAENPYGDGKASYRIVQSILNRK
jgi:UDP-N-acetylglucosamine 2-epimerase (non-hydrolysing)